MLSQSLNLLKDQGDPLADTALADYQDAQPEVRALLEQGMRQGLSKINAMPQSFRQLLQDSEAAVASMALTQLDKAMEPYAWIGPTWMSIALGPGSLAHTYSDPGIAAVLMRTGNLLSQTVSRRLLETQLWKISVIRPGGLAIGGSGYVHTLQVRMLHARVRATLIQRGWQSENGNQAVPIDQLQMLRTWLDFTVVPLEALHRIGLDFSENQRHELYAAWRLIGQLLGIAPVFLSTVTDHAVALNLLDLVDSELPPPDSNSRVLTQAMLNAIGNRLAPVLGLPTDISVLLMSSYCRLFHGDELGDRLGVEANWTSSLIPMVTDANRFRISRIVEDPAYRAAIVEQSQNAYRQIESGLSDATAYQSMSASLVTDQLPTVLSPHPIHTNGTKPAKK